MCVYCGLSMYKIVARFSEKKKCKCQLYCCFDHEYLYFPQMTRPIIEFLGLCQFVYLTAINQVRINGRLFHLTKIYFIPEKKKIYNRFIETKIC